MAEISQSVFAKNLFALLKETFEGPGGSVCLDKGAGLFQTLDPLTAEAASHKPRAGGRLNLRLSTGDRWQATPRRPARGTRADFQVQRLWFRLSAASN